MPADSEPPRVEDLDAIAKVFDADRETHIYGLADLDEPFRSHSIWFEKNGALVGVISTGGDWVAGYAMSQVDPTGTLNLLLTVQKGLPAGTWVTGPLGLAEAVEGVREVRPVGRHWRMILVDFAAHGAEEVRDLGHDDLNALIDLYESEPDAAFFLPTMVEHGHFVGIEDDGVLVAAAGTHVASKERGVAALGAILTRPGYRGRGLGLAVIEGLCARLIPHYETVGLNVAASNAAAISLYERIGFTARFDYEEVELL
jgi:ribosomal protein S18 acetylase RimI-like enzyme